MHKYMVALAILSAMSGSATAQNAPQAQLPAAPHGNHHGNHQGPVATAEQPKPQMVKKVVCRRVQDDEATGSRISGSRKVCTTIEVPVGGSANSDRAPVVDGPERGQP